MDRRSNRRTFLKGASALGLAVVAPKCSESQPISTLETGADADGIAIDDSDWSLWLDRLAAWKEDTIYLPEQFDLKSLPVNGPTGGWENLYLRNSGADFKTVRLPTTVEEHFWGSVTSRSYGPLEYFYAPDPSDSKKDDYVPRNGAYRGVSWFYRNITISSSMAGKRIILDVRAARMRAEVYLNGTLVGYSIMEELPFSCDLTGAAKLDGPNHLAIRITNPGGGYDWNDRNTIRWGRVDLYRSHGFGGLDRGMKLRAVPSPSHIEDVWVLNTSNPRAIIAKVKEAKAGMGDVRVEVIDPSTGEIVAGADAAAQIGASPDSATHAANIIVPGAKLWDLDSPVLYQLRVSYKLHTGETEVRHVTFAFRSYGPEGLGSNAVFRLNGRRIKIYTAISWGFWGFNGLFPTPALAEREVRQAKRLNLNCLNFHRNVGKEEVFRAQDRLGLLRYMEPGGGMFTVSRASSDPVTEHANKFLQQFMLEKCRAMVRAFRSHPSLIQYTLQNEFDSDLKNPETFKPLEIMHAEDPSRCVVLNDGFKSEPQVWFAPYDDTPRRTDRDQFGGWWNNHQGADYQWYDRLYEDPTHYTYRQPLDRVLVEWGEMEGCAVADNHPLMTHQIEARQFGGSGSSYDLSDHREITDAYERFFMRWDFRNAFPSSEIFFRSLGNKCYESWQQYMENIRICDQVDFAAISGWESTAIENHSGIVDNLRNFKGNPDLIAGSLRPLRPVAKQHALCVSTGQVAVFDLYLLNETGETPRGQLHFDVIDPLKRRFKLGSFPAPAAKRDQFSYLLQAGFTTPVLQDAGVYKFVFRFDADPTATFSRDVWAVDAGTIGRSRLRVATAGVVSSLDEQLRSLSYIECEPFRSGRVYDLIVTSGVVSSQSEHAIGDLTSTETPTEQPNRGRGFAPGRIPDDVLAIVRQGTPLLVAVPDDALADGVARQLAALGSFNYNGQVGDIRAPWMGNWMFVRRHPTFAGLPVDCALGVHYQAQVANANGLLIERATGAPDPEVIMGYSRDHDRRIGAASFLCWVDDAPILVHRCPEFSKPLQLRWLNNALAHLHELKTKVI